MKRILIFAVFLIIAGTVPGQVPASFKYQAVLRDARGNIKAKTATNIIIDILQGSATGNVVYSETHRVTTDSFGLINLDLGNGSASVGSMSAINWNTGIYFVKVTVDGAVMGTSQLLSVPYALYSEESASDFSGDYNDLINKPTLSNGTVTNVTGTAPVNVVTGTTSPVISMPQASGTSDGYLSSADWIKFSNTSTFDGTWGSLAVKPTTLTGFGITDAMNTSHIANSITLSNITNWNTAYSWGNHAGLYKPVGYIPSWNDITNNPFSITSASNNQLLRYNSGSGKWENWTANYITGYTETDPVFTSWNKSAGISITNTQISNWSSATSGFLTGITSGQIITALGFTPYNSTNPSGYTSNTGTVTSVAFSAPTGLTVSGTPITTSGTINLTITSGYAIPTTSQLFPGFGITVDKAAYGNHTHDYSGVYAALTHNHNGIYEPVIAAGTLLQYWRGDKTWQTLNTTAVAEGANLYFTNARARAAISLTTTGNSGAATYSSATGIINIPNYTLAGLGGQAALNGTGLVRMSGTTVSYDNNTYLTSYTETQNLTNVLTLGTDAGNKKMVNVSQVGIGIATPDASAAVEIKSTTQGLLLPRMTAEQINALTPVEGLLVYNTTSSNLTYYGNGKWYELTNKACFPNPTASNAGLDKTVGTTSTNLAGNTPVFGTGTWTIVTGTGGVIADIHNPTSVFTGTLGAGYVLTWSISTPCSTSTDNVIISLGPTCSNGIMDGTETDIDCGGGCPNGCAGGRGCRFDTDCCCGFVCFGGGTTNIGTCVIF